MTDLYTRSYNPIWDFRSLTGLPLDDTSWAYFLTNDLPYIPQNVYQDPNGTPWNSPVQLSAAGTLQNIFFDPSLVYRIEIRTNDGNLTPPTQNDALVWLIEDYIPVSGGVVPPEIPGAIANTNQITNPQFSLINFSSPLGPLSLSSPDPINVAPGWFLLLTGSGEVTLTQIPLTSASNAKTGAPYALEVNLVGWTTAYLYQDFQSGTIWGDKWVTASITARIEGAIQPISLSMFDSLGNPLGTILTDDLGSSYNEFIGSIKLPASVNTQDPSTAYVELRVNLPGTSVIRLTSLQLISTDEEVPLDYQENTIERQVDQTFHYYRDSILFEPKESLLTGWDFPLNPWQFTTKTISNLSGFGGVYTADQTIVVSETTGSIQVGSSTTPAAGYFSVVSIPSQTQGRVAVIQYIDPATIASQWGNILSSLVEMQLSTSASTTLKVKMRLIWSNTLPTTGGVGISPILSWGAVDPIFTSQWNSLIPINDPAYLLTSSLSEYSYNGFQLPLNTNPTATLGIVLYTTGPMSSASADSCLIKTISLVNNDFAIKANPLSFDETLRRCQYYYEKSYSNGVLPGTVTQIGMNFCPTFYGASGATGLTLFAFQINYDSVKRTTMPSITLYSPESSSAGNVCLYGYNFFGVQTSTNTLSLSGNIIQYNINEKRVSFNAKNFDYRASPTAGYSATCCQITIDARLGLVP